MNSTSHYVVVQEIHPLFSLEKEKSHLKAMLCLVPQAIVRVTRVPPVCQSSPTGETLQSAVLPLALPASLSPVRRASKLQYPLLLQGSALLCLNTHQPLTELPAGQTNTEHCIFIKLWMQDIK